jgi:glycosyltransferase A (GT-A) superfamily protein (DUF2064 family)
MDGMPTVAVLADPPVEGAVLPELVPNSPLSAADAAALYEAMLADVCEAVQNGAGELLVNYRPGERVADGIDSQARIDAVLSSELPRPGDLRYEVQVGETLAGRAGNTVTHLLEAEGVDSVVVLEPTAAFLSRETLGTATMKLRTRDAVVGPTSDGRAYLAGFVAPVDFEEIFASPAVETIVERAREAGLEVDFTPMLPVIEQAGDLETAVSVVRARVRAGRNVPPRTAQFVADRDLQVVSQDGDLTVVEGLP